MARIQSPLFGAASGQVAGLELYRSKGINYARAAKLKRYKLKTESQIYREQLFKLLVTAISALSPIMPNFSIVRKSQWTFFNYFIKKNYHLYTYNAELRNIRCQHVELMSFFRYTIKIKSVVSEWDYTAFVGFLASIESNYLSDAYAYTLLGVSQFGREFSQLSGYVDVASKTVLVQAYPFIPFNGSDFHVFMLVSDVNDSKNAIIFESYLGLVPAPK